MRQTRFTSPYNFFQRIVKTPSHASPITQCSTTRTRLFPSLVRIPDPFVPDKDVTRLWTMAARPPQRRTRGWLVLTPPKSTWGICRKQNQQVRGTIKDRLRNGLENCCYYKKREENIFLPILTEGKCKQKSWRLSIFLGKIRKILFFKKSKR